MELLIPFMLFILDWREGGEPELTRHPAVYAAENDCRDAGTAMTVDSQGTADETRFWCMPVPSNEEFDVLMKQIEADHVARRDARDAMRQRPETQLENQPELRPQP